MSMSKRNYEVIVDLLARSQTVDEAAEALAGYFAAENPRFDPRRFSTAYLVKSEGYNAERREHDSWGL